MLAESAYENLEALNDWELEHKEQDIRNRPLVTSTGESLGTIDDLLIDRGAERVAAVRLEDGRVCAVEALEIHPTKVIYKPAGEVEAYGRDAVTDVDADTIQLVEEQVAVGKRAVVGDTIRVSSKVVTDTVSKTVDLQHEEAFVTTSQTEEVISSADADALFQDQTIEVTEINEVPVVAKRAVKTGEVQLGKTATVDAETITESVRKTVVDIDETVAQSVNDITS